MNIKEYFNGQVKNEKQNLLNQEQDIDVRNLAQYIKIYGEEVKLTTKGKELVDKAAKVLNKD